jgi:limonene-1,2-epoxide hydrolase
MRTKRTTLALLLAGGILAMTMTTPARADTDAQKLAVVKKMLNAWDTMNWTQVVELFADDGVLHSMMNEPIVGRAAIKERIMQLAAGTKRIELKVAHIGVIDGLVFIERVDDFDFNGHVGLVPVVGIMDIDHGRVRAWREYYDRAQLLKGMGVEAGGAH